VTDAGVVADEKGVGEEIWGCGDVEGRDG